mgnify:FL=1
MYFSIVPSIVYDEKPIKYPFSDADRVIAKNFFRRYKLNDDIFSYAVFFNKYAIEDGERPDILADKLYGSPKYDWVILLTNNLVNAQYDWPLSNYDLIKTLEKEYDDPYNEIHHYETIKIAQYPAGLRVDKAFYDKQHKLNIDGNIVLKNGSEICGAVSVAEHFNNENEKRREIYILKEEYFQSFINDFKRDNNYKKSKQYIDTKLKFTG